jgi:hypothetical protein
MEINGGGAFFFDKVENAVHEYARLFGGKGLRDLDRFVDDDRDRRARIVDQLVGAHAQQIAVERGHAVQFPVLRVLLDDHVQFRAL